LRSQQHIGQITFLELLDTYEESAYLPPTIRMNWQADSKIATLRTDGDLCLEVKRGMRRIVCLLMSDLLDNL